MNLNLDAQFWENRYIEQQTGWDIGAVSTPLKTYFDQLANKNLKILIPGCGNAHEAEYLHQQGFTEVYVLDWSASALQNFKERVPSFKDEHLIAADFFKHEGQYDLIIEQTFFCALNPEKREAYVQQMHQLLKPDGKLVGLLFNIPLNTDKPPFGGSQALYERLFEPLFHIKALGVCKNSIKPRAGNELFANFAKKMA